MATRRLMTVVLAAVLLLAGCTGTGIPEGPVPPDQPADEDANRNGDDPNDDDQTDPDPQPTQEWDDERVPAAVDDAATRADVDNTAVEVIHLHEVNWPDGAIGCPQPGMNYTQALVAGYHLLMEVDGEPVHYHAAGEEDFFHCANPQEPVPDHS